MGYAENQELYRLRGRVLYAERVLREILRQADVSIEHKMLPANGSDLDVYDLVNEGWESSAKNIGTFPSTNP